MSDSNVLVFLILQNGTCHLPGCHGKREGNIKGLSYKKKKGVICCQCVCEYILCAQVWYHVCPNRGRGCYNTQLKENGGCTIWYNEKEVNKDSQTEATRQTGFLENKYHLLFREGIAQCLKRVLKKFSYLLFFLSVISQLLSEIEEHLKCTITQCEPDIKIPVDEFDGKVTYGQRRALGGIRNSLNSRVLLFFVLMQSFLSEPVVSVQVETIRVTWMCWPRLFRSWPFWREKLRPPSFTWDTCQTSCSELSDYKITSMITLQPNLSACN